MPNPAIDLRSAFAQRPDEDHRALGSPSEPGHSHETIRPEPTARRERPGDTGDHARGPGGPESSTPPGPPTAARSAAEQVAEEAALEAAKLDPAEIAAKLRAALIDRVGAARVDRWLGDAELRIDERGLEIRTTRPLAKRILDQTMARELREAAAVTLGHDTAVRIAIAPPDPSAPARQTLPATSDGNDGPDATPGTGPDAGPDAARGNARGVRPSGVAGVQARRDGGLRDLDGYVVGTSNRLAWTAAMQTGDPREHAPAGILFMHGDCGVGKTHLLQGICRRYRNVAAATGLPSRVRYVTGEQFTNEFIAAVRDHTIERFRDRVRRLDLLAIDDIHFLENKVRTQNELLHTLDAIGLTGARIVLASDGHPTLIRRCSRGLVNRFLSGMVIEVERPDRETRRLIARRIADARSMRLGEAAVEAIASRCVGSVREIEGAVTKIAAMHQLLAANGAEGQADAEREVGLCTVERVLHDAAARPARPVQITGLIEAACRRLDLARSDVVGGSRRGRASLGRSVVSFLAKDMTAASYPEIARGLGLASHASVHRAVQTTRRRIQDEEVVGDVNGERIELRELIDQVRHAAWSAAGRATNG